MNNILRLVFASTLLPLAFTAQAHEVGGPVEEPTVIGDDVFHQRTVMVLWATACTADGERATAYFLVQPSLSDQFRNRAWINYGDVEGPLKIMWEKAAREFSSQDFHTETVDPEEPGKFPAAVRQAVSRHENDFIRDVEQRSENVTVRIAKYGYYDKPSGACPMPETS